MTSPTRSGRRRFIIFLLVGGFSALINVAARLALSQVMSFEVAIIVAYVAAMLTAYILSRIFVFEASGRSVGDELSRFAIVNVVAILQVWLVTVTLNYHILPFLGWPYDHELTAHLIGVASPVFTSYLGHKYFSFGSRKDAP
jgi:putative flippase GtrA